MWDGMTLDEFQAKLDEAKKTVDFHFSEGDRLNRLANAHFQESRRLGDVIAEEVNEWKKQGREWYT